MKVRSKLHFILMILPFLKNLACAKNAFRIVREFEKSSELKLNMEKCEGMWLESNHQSNDTLFEIKWPKRQTKVLGTYIEYNMTEAIELFYEDKIARL